MPANNVLESYLFGGMVKGGKRMWLKNLSRAAVVAVIILTAIVMVNDIPLVIELVGSLTCAPLAFTLPALFHYKACAVTSTQKAIDLTIVISTSALTVLCVSLSISTIFA